MLARANTHATTAKRRPFRTKPPVFRYPGSVDRPDLGRADTRQVLGKRGPGVAAVAADEVQAVGRAQVNAGRQGGSAVIASRRTSSCPPGNPALTGCGQWGGAVPGFASKDRREAESFGSARGATRKPPQPTSRRLRRALCIRRPSSGRQGTPARSASDPAPPCRTARRRPTRRWCRSSRPPRTRRRPAPAPPRP